MVVLHRNLSHVGAINRFSAGIRAVGTFNGESIVCAECISDDHFNTWIQQNGTPGTCEFVKSHGYQPHTVTVSALAESVDDAFRAKYQLGGEEPHFYGDNDRVSYEQRGDPLNSCLAEVLGCDEDIADALIPELPDASHYEIAQGGEAFYDDSQNYERIADVRAREKADQEEYWYENRFRYGWEEFCDKVQYKQRFFNIKDLLDDLFGKPEEYVGGKINPVYVLDPGAVLFRARRLDADFTHEVLQSGPAQCLGAPPRERARAGRMNVEFIPAFYAAFSEDTAVAEIRPGIGEEVAIAQFLSRVPFTVFDFTVFQRLKSEDWRQASGHTRYDFIHQMESQISKPVLAYEQQREYIATQIVAEYLKAYFSCDAVIYRSSMIRDDKAENRNIVILPREATFIGDGPAVLTYRSHEVKQVLDVTYQLMRGLF